MSLSSKRVRNKGDVSSNLWLIGESPGEKEEVYGEPFIGPAGELLFDILNSQGIERKDVFLGNLCQYRPFQNRFKFCENTQQLRDGIRELQILIQLHKPNCVVLLGAKPLYYMANLKGIGGWRGSILMIDNQKFIPAYHPSGVLREFGNYPILAHDLKRAISDSAFPEPRYDTYTIVTNPTEEHYQILKSKSIFSCDIETTRAEKIIKCVGFGFDWTGISFWLDGGLNNMWVKDLLKDEKIEKVFHLGAFDTSVLTKLPKLQTMFQDYVVNSYTHDTIVQAHILEPEFPRGLDFLGSIHTRIPYYKKEGREAIPKSDTKSWTGKRSKEELLEYNAKDCIVTIQSHYNQIKRIMEERLERIYRHEMDLNQECIDFSANGILRDQVRTEEIRTIIKKKMTDDYITLIRLIQKKVNVRSYIDMPELLYKDLGLPIKRKRNEEESITTDEDALVSLMGFCVNKLAEYKSDEKRIEWATKLGIVKLIIRIRGHLKMLSSYINSKDGPDGRTRSLFKAFGTETGRLSAVKYVDDTGMNLQTVPRESIEV